MSDIGASHNPFGADPPPARPFVAAQQMSGVMPKPSAHAAMAAAALRPLASSTGGSGSPVPGAVRSAATSAAGGARATPPASSQAAQSAASAAHASNPFGPDPPTATRRAAQGAAPLSPTSAAAAVAFPTMYGPPLHVDAYLCEGCPVPMPRVTPEGALAVCAPAPLAGETPIFRDIECYFRSPVGVRLMGTLSASTYQVVFSWFPPVGSGGGGGGAAGASAGAGAVAAGGCGGGLSPTSGLLPGSLRHIHSSFFAAPVTAIRRIDKGTPRGKEAGSVFTVDLAFKDVRSWTLVFKDEGLADRVFGHLRMVAFPSKVDFLHAFEEAKALGLSAAAAAPSSASSSPSPLPGWEVYNPYRELERMGVLDCKHPRTGEQLWRVSDVNREYRYCPTYPSVLVFPERIPDAALPAVGAFRSKARVPALTWQHPVNKTTLWRCSQPRVGMGNNTCQQDEALFAAIREANVFSRDPSAPLLIADCRPRANAMANKAGGWGYENYAFGQLEFLGIHNIHAVRDAYRKMEALSLASAASDVNWAAAVSDAGWLYHVRSLLSSSLFVAESMHRRGQSVVVHCSDGWDRTAQVCGLVQLLLDPYSRTLRGLCSLVAKEWASFGHKFHERCGHGNERADADGDFSPIFIQWLDAIAQLVRQFPFAFEFSERALLVMGHHLYSCRFGTFLFNCERERLEARLPFRTQSLWACLLHGPPERTRALTNPGYDPAAGDVLLPHASACLRGVEVWREWFLRWSPFPSILPGACRLERYPTASYDHSRVAAASLGPAVRAVAPSPLSRAGAGGSSSVVSVAPAAAAAPEPMRDPLTGAIVEEEAATPTSPASSPLNAARRAGQPAPLAAVTPSGTATAAAEGTLAPASGPEDTPAAAAAGAAGLAGDIDAEAADLASGVAGSDMSAGEAGVVIEPSLDGVSGGGGDDDEDGAMGGAMLSRPHGLSESGEEGGGRDAPSPSLAAQTEGGPAGSAPASRRGSLPGAAADNNLMNASAPMARGYEEDD